MSMWWMDWWTKYKRVTQVKGVTVAGYAISIIQDHLTKLTMLSLLLQWKQRTGYLFESKSQYLCKSKWNSNHSDTGTDMLLMPYQATQTTAKRLQILNCATKKEGAQLNIKSNINNKCFFLVCELVILNTGSVQLESGMGGGGLGPTVCVNFPVLRSDTEAPFLSNKIDALKVLSFCIVNCPVTSSTTTKHKIICVIFECGWEWYSPPSLPKATSQCCL